MPEFMVNSGDFNIRINRRSARQAAVDAIGLLKNTEENIRWGFLVGVCGIDTDEFVYLSTLVLMKKNGIKFKLLDKA